MFEFMVSVVALCVIGVSSTFLYLAVKIWRQEKNSALIMNARSPEEAMFLNAMRAIETGKPVVGNYDAKSGKLESKVLESQD